MTEIVPTTVPGPVPAEESAVFERSRTDATLTGRAMYVAGLLAAAEVDTVGGPEKLPTDLWPEVDPALVLEIWGRAGAVAWRAARFGESPRDAERLQGLQEALTAAGFGAMGGLVGRSQSLVVRAGLPADSEVAREH
ncbi:hypothetical protein ACWC4D_33845 [Streptomyces sp. NPDC001288]